MFDKYGDKMGKILRSALTDGVLMRKILFESDVLFFSRFKPSVCAKLTSEHQQLQQNIFAG